MADFPPVARLIPHRGPAVLLSRVLFHDEQSTKCLAVVDSSMQYLEGDRADAALALELMAQGIAVHVSLERKWSSDAPRAGYVVGVPKMNFIGGDYREGDRLEVTVRPVFHEGPVGRFEGLVTCAGMMRAEGTLTVFEPPLDSGPAARDDSAHGSD